MRFYEFREDQLPVYDSHNEFIKEMALDKKNSRLNESDDEDNEKVVEIREFIKRYVVDPKSLTIGENYYPIELRARPFNNLIEIALADQSLEYFGEHDSKFVFKGVTAIIKLPVNIDNIEEYGPYMIITTVYTTVDQCDQFLTILAAQFSGRWQIKQKKLKL